MYMKKVLARSVRCLILMRSEGAVSPPQGPMLVSGGEKGAKSQDLVFCTAKNGQKQQDFR